MDEQETEKMKEAVREAVREMGQQVGPFGIITENLAPQSWVATFLLCTFLGPVGAHRFYAHRTGSAVAQLILTIFTAGIASGIWAFVDWVTILAQCFQNSEGQFIKIH